jgi:hypothetical protein
MQIVTFSIADGVADQLLIAGAEGLRVVIFGWSLGADGLQRIDVEDTDGNLLGYLTAGARFANTIPPNVYPLMQTANGAGVQLDTNNAFGTGVAVGQIWYQQLDGTKDYLNP